MQLIDLDEMLPYVGEYGCFQILLQIIMCLTMIPVTFPKLVMYFAALKPDWRCVENSSVCLMNGTFSPDDDTRCSMPRGEWEFTEPVGFSIVTQFDIYCGNEWIIYMSTTVCFVGMAVGAVVLGWFADNYGRKVVLYFSTSVLLVVGFLSAFSPNVWWFMVFRFIVGFFVPGASVQLVIMASELVGTKFRPAASMSLWVFSGLALCFMGLQAYYIREWKTLCMILTAPYIILLFTWWFVPESCRWLRVKGKTDQAMLIMQRAAKWNRKTFPKDVKLSAPPSIKHTSTTSVVDLFSSCKVATSTSIQCFAWLINGMLYYGLSLAADDLGGDLYFNYVLASAVEFPAVIIGILGCSYWGRKKTVITSFLTGSVACVLVPFFPIDGKWHVVRLVLGIFGKFCISMDHGSFYTWSVELFPTDVRASGMGILQVTSRIGAASAPWVAKGLKTVHKTLPFITMGVLAFISSLLICFLPETKDLKTAETLHDVEKSKGDTENVKLMEKT